MIDGVEIKGGANEFEAAVIAVVIDHIAEEERAPRATRPDQVSRLPAWVRAARPEEQLSLPAREQRWSAH